jgi:membrane associated rhomboid family serine protease
MCSTTLCGLDILIGVEDAPMTIALAAGSAGMLLLQSTVWGPEQLQRYFAAVPWRFMTWTDLAIVRRCVLYVLVHKDLTHLIANYSSILLVGPALEKRLGSARLLGLVVLTAVITALTNAVLFEAGIIGSSGLVMMMLLLLAGSEMQVQRAGESEPTGRSADAAGLAFGPMTARPAARGRLRIPLPLLLLLGIYLSRELAGVLSGAESGVSRFAHLSGVAAGLAAALVFNGGTRARRLSGPGEFSHRMGGAGAG